MAIRKKNWKCLFDEFPIFEKQMKIKILNYYDEHLRRPLLKKRQIDLDKLQ
jgi:hypothetical protein